MKHIHTFERFINESIINEGSFVDFNLRAVPKIVKDYVSRTKYIKNYKGQGRWSAAAEPIIITDRDFDVKGKSASGNYLLLSLYKFAGEYKIEWAAVRPDAKYPNGIGIFQKAIDQRAWENLLKAHQRQMVDPDSINSTHIKNAGDVLGQFITDELRAMGPVAPVKGQFEPASRESVKLELESAYKDVTVEILKDGRVRADFYHKRAGDGRNVPKTNLVFLIDAPNQIIEFVNPDSSQREEIKYNTLKDIGQFIQQCTRAWKDEDKRRSDAMSQSAFKLDR
jgi:hypothetical protein